MQRLAYLQITFTEVALFDKLRDSWAREQAQGEPVNDFVQGPWYDASSGQMWFPCAHDRFCMVKGHIAPANKRDAVVRQLAQLVEKRLR